MASHSEPVVDANHRLVTPPPTRRTAIGGYQRVAAYEQPGEQLYNCKRVRHLALLSRLWFERSERYVAYGVGAAGLAVVFKLIIPDPIWACADHIDIYGVAADSQGDHFAVWRSFYEMFEFSIVSFIVNKLFWIV